MKRRTAMLRFRNGDRVEAALPSEPRGVIAFSTGDTGEGGYGSGRIVHFWYREVRGDFVLFDEVPSQ